MSDCGCGSNDYYGDTGAYNSYCNADTPYPSISHESVPSLIDNLVNALYGAITKDVSSGKVVWNIPCDPSNIPATINGIPRYDGEGLLCYIVRALNLTGGSGIVTVDGTQTLTNKTLTAPLINGGTINNLTATGTLTLPAGSITSAMIANGTIVPIDLSTGGPYWDSSGNVILNGGLACTYLTATGAIALPAGSITSTMIANGAIVDANINASAGISNSKLAGNPSSTNTASTIVLRDASGNFSAGTITASLSGNATSATNLAGTTANQIPYQSASSTTSYISAGTTGQMLIQGASAPTWGTDHIGVSTSTSTPPTSAASGYVGELLTWTSSATSITTGQTLNLLSLTSASSPSLTSGDWKFYGTIVFAASSTTIANGQTFTGGIGTTSATTTAGKRISLLAPTYTTTSFTIEIPLITVPILQPASAQTVYVVATAPAFTAGTMTATAYISARRMR
jgi:hypothetical protein